MHHLLRFGMMMEQNNDDDSIENEWISKEGVIKMICVISTKGTRLCLKILN